MEIKEEEEFHPQMKRMKKFTTVNKKRGD